MGETTATYVVCARSWLVRWLPLRPAHADGHKWVILDPVPHTVVVWGWLATIALKLVEIRPQRHVVVQRVHPLRRSGVVVRMYQLPLHRHMPVRQECE